MEVADLIRQKPSSPFDEVAISTCQKSTKRIGNVSVLAKKGLTGIQQLLENVQDSGYLHRMLPKTITIGKKTAF